MEPDDMMSMRYGVHDHSCLKYLGYISFWRWEVKAHCMQTYSTTNPHLAFCYLQFHLVQQRLPVQTEVTFLFWIKSILVEGKHFRPRTLGRDLSTNGQRALIGWYRDLTTACGQAYVQAQQALAMPPSATKVPLIFTWNWWMERQKEVHTDKW